ncbi:serine/arginine-rich splicing factor 7 isoform X2 [Leptinotarsa decemlineata]|uniref:serine/arginine-rich splicing factor 7 isoform X2 n=1 Tax=Leptinotarsa decemlineata TaxID=7539 RepID=UPI000C255918|nr:serine/arginine-rich splicing factor 7-like isoform X2 [Leptinotarsa decemlineata]
MRDNDRDSPASGTKRSRSKSSNSSTSRKSRSRSRSSASRSRSRSGSSEIDGYRLHIADIGDEIRRSDLEKVFSQYGPLKEVWMTNSTPCFGFAVFKDKKHAATALKACDGMEVSGCRIRVSYARPRTRGSGRRFYNTNMRCYQCGYSGHFYRDCPEVNGRSEKRERGDRETDRHMVVYLNGLVKEYCMDMYDGGG